MEIAFTVDPWLAHLLLWALIIAAVLSCIEAVLRIIGFKMKREIREIERATKREPRVKRVKRRGPRNNPRFEVGLN